jgi:hypothetical protein
MTTCDGGRGDEAHDEIVHDEPAGCPLCASKKELGEAWGRIDDLEIAAEKTQARIQQLKSTISDLGEHICGLQKRLQDAGEEP